MKRDSDFVFHRLSAINFAIIITTAASILCISHLFSPRLGFVAVIRGLELTRAVIFIIKVLKVELVRNVLKYRKCRITVDDYCYL